MKDYTEFCRRLFDFYEEYQEYVDEHFFVRTIDHFTKNPKHLLSPEDWRSLRNLKWPLCFCGTSIP